MEFYKPYPNEITNAIKSQIAMFINRSNSIDEETKLALKKELGTNWSDDRVNTNNFFDHAISYSYEKWQRNELKVLELWKEVAINNSKINNNPHLVADKVIKKYCKEFNIEL